MLHDDSVAWFMVMMITKIGDNAYILHGDCHRIITIFPDDVSCLLPVHLTFFDPPFNQGKDYENCDDDVSINKYWYQMEQLCERVRAMTIIGGSIYFMQREKNVDRVMTCLNNAGWTIQSIIIWRKRASAVPQTIRFSKSYQIIVFATNGCVPASFNKLRIDLPLDYKQSIPREKGVIISDVWDDILELTSGYLAGDEAFRDPVSGERLHEQQSPVALLLRIILASTVPGNIVFDPFAGTGTSSVVAKQLGRTSISIENGAGNIAIIEERLKTLREVDDITKYATYYRFTEQLDDIWSDNGLPRMSRHVYPPIF
jgi:DNA modification methylase